MKRINKRLIKKFFYLVKSAKSILITGHIHPDADVIGSALAIYKGIRKNFPRKKIDIIFKDKYPYWLKFLPNIQKIKIKDKIFKKYDLGIILECSDISRTGGLINFTECKYFINIDHHLNHNQKNSTKNKLNLIYPNYASCAEIIFDIFKKLKIKFDRDISIYLYIGVVTDTGKFQWANTTAHTFETAKALLKYGIKPYEIYKNLYRQKTLNSMLLLAKVLSTMEIIKINKVKIGLITARYKMFKQTHTTTIDTEDFINFPMDVAGTNISIFLREENPNVVKVSFRSDSINVEKIARYWGGGGHKFASGMTLKGDIEKVKYSLLKYLKKILKYQ